MLDALPIIFGLAIFEILSSFDNAVINANISQTLSPHLRRFFHTWGLFFAVFVVRGLLPFLIAWIANPGISLGKIISGIFTNEIDITLALELSRPFLLLGGGFYLQMVFLSWLFREKKEHAFLVERFIERRDSWFYFVVGILSVGLVSLAFYTSTTLVLPVLIALALFFIVDGFKRSAEREEKKHHRGSQSGLMRLLYLEILDASFSVDGVIGAFAFTLNIPWIIIGSGIGALVVRQLTVRGTALIMRFAYLKNGSMYSIGLLGVVMLMESFGSYFPFWLTPMIALAVMTFFLSLSIRRRHFKQLLKTKV